MFSIWLLPLAASGLFISLYILSKKLRKEELVCLMGKGCDKVVKSKYGYMMGVPNEIIGSLFYVWILIVVISSVVEVTDIFEERLLFLVYLSVILAFLSSIGLTAIQAFVLKEWCEMCLAAAGINALIFFLVAFQ